MQHLSLVEWTVFTFEFDRSDERVFLVVNFELIRNPTRLFLAHRVLRGICG